MSLNPSACGSARSPAQVRASFAAQAEAAFREFVMRPEFPCLGAKAALNLDSCTLRTFAELGSAAATGPLAEALYRFTTSIAAPRATEFTQHPGHRSALPEDAARLKGPGEYATFVAIFERPVNLNELEFENLFWKQLRALHQQDATTFDWDPNVKSDPADPQFSFSFGGQALYVIGMHANSSREARQFRWPAMVFNPHEQFERLRADGKWRRMQESIRNRDLALQGSINPMLSDFGEQSEARQYSGRAVEENWQAPFPKAAGKCPFAY